MTERLLGEQEMYRERRRSYISSVRSAISAVMRMAYKTHTIAPFFVLEGVFTPLLTLTERALSAGRGDDIAARV